MKIAALVVSIVCVANPSSASEAWACVFKSLSGSAQRMSGQARVEIGGGTFAWLLPPPPGGSDWPKFSYKIVLDNESGTVAVAPHAENDPKSGSLIGAAVIVLRKTDGSLRLGSVVVDGIHDGLAGQCHKS
jgi:hypothetical protein